MFALLLRKEWAELRASPAFLLMLVVTSALVTHAFSNATSLYAEASGAGGGVSALAQGLNPLDGIVVPVLGVYDLAATFLLPFVVIRIFAAERDAGMQPVLLQLPPSWRMSVAAKCAALTLGWCVNGIAGVVALAAWVLIGGHLHGAETIVVAVGHVLRGLITIGLGAAIAAVTTNAATASLTILGVTIGSWALDYVAAARGGVAGFVAQFTPTALLKVFERGELRVSVVLMTLMLSAIGAATAAIWMREGEPLRARTRRITLLIAIGILSVSAASRIRFSADVSEDRRNSFPEVEEEALNRVVDPISISVNLAAQDPRLADFERGVLAKLRRLRNVRVAYVAKGRTGLFESPSANYGEIAYTIGDTTVVSRSVSEPVVVQVILDAARIPLPSDSDAEVYSGYPLARVAPTWTFILQLVWPVAIIFMWFTRRTIGARPAIPN